MTKGDLIFDWQKPESSFRVKMLSYILVGIIFTFLFGSLKVGISVPTRVRAESASILRFRDDEMGRSWTLQAEEDGPFPGRLSFDGFLGGLEADGSDGVFPWHVYRSGLREIGNDGSYANEDIAPKGVRVFPSIIAVGGDPGADPPIQTKMAMMPILIPYDSYALAWMPDRLPDIAIPEGAEKMTTAWRFAVNLRENGTVKEAISLVGGEDAGQALMERWLHGVRFKEGSSDRWLGLRVEFANRPDDGTDPK